MIEDIFNYCVYILEVIGEYYRNGIFSSKFSNICYNSAFINYNFLCIVET
jgi:hypothetical protein